MATLLSNITVTVNALPDGNRISWTPYLLEQSAYYLLIKKKYSIPRSRVDGLVLIKDKDILEYVDEDVKDGETYYYRIFISLDGQFLDDTTISDNKCIGKAIGFKNSIEYGDFLYANIPEQVRYADSSLKSDLPLKRFFNLLSFPYNKLDTYSDNILQQLDLDICDEMYLPYHAKWMGIKYNENFGPEINRLILKTLNEGEAYVGTKKGIEYILQRIFKAEVEISIDNDVSINVINIAIDSNNAWLFEHVDVINQMIEDYCALRTKFVTVMSFYDNDEIFDRLANAFDPYLFDTIAELIEDKYNKQIKELDFVNIKDVNSDVHNKAKNDEYLDTFKWDFLEIYRIPIKELTSDFVAYDDSENWHVDPNGSEVALTNSELFLTNTNLYTFSYGMTQISKHAKDELIDTIIYTSGDDNYPIENCEDELVEEMQYSLDDSRTKATNYSVLDKTKVSDSDEFKKVIADVFAESIKYTLSDDYLVAKDTDTMSIVVNSILDDERLKSSLDSFIDKAKLTDADIFEKSILDNLAESIKHVLDDNYIAIKDNDVVTEAIKYVLEEVRTKALTYSVLDKPQVYDNDEFEKLMLDAITESIKYTLTDNYSVDKNTDSITENVKSQLDDERIKSSFDSFLDKSLFTDVDEFKKSMVDVLTESMKYVLDDNYVAIKNNDTVLDNLMYLLEDIRKGQSSDSFADKPIFTDIENFEKEMLESISESIKNIPIDDNYIANSNGDIFIDKVIYILDDINTKKSSDSFSDKPITIDLEVLNKVISETFSESIKETISDNYNISNCVYVITEKLTELLSTETRLKETIYSVNDKISISDGIDLFNKTLLDAYLDKVTDILVDSYLTTKRSDELVSSNIKYLLLEEYTKSRIDIVTESLSSVESDNLSKTKVDSTLDIVKDISVDAETRKDTDEILHPNIFETVTDNYNKNKQKDDIVERLDNEPIVEVNNKTITETVDANYSYSRVGLTSVEEGLTNTSIYTCDNYI